MDKPRNKAIERKKLSSQINAQHLKLNRKNEGMHIGSSKNVDFHFIIIKDIGSIVYNNWIWFFLGKFPG